MNEIRDSFGRKVTYLRLSVTDRCDFRCTYCMAEKMQFLPREEILSLEECLKVARTFVEMGVSKIRLTGGEPLTRKDLPWLVERLRQLPGLSELTLTTNGSQLVRFAQPLAQAGIDRVNISLDSLDADTFQRITRTGNLSQVLAGIDAAIAAWGSRHVKLNTVLIRDINHLEAQGLAQFALSRGIDISFIEQMPLGETDHHQADSYFSNADMLPLLKQHFELIPSLENSGGPARYWRVSGSESRIGFISPHSHNFCADCNRMRVTAKGELYSCLGNVGMVELLPAVRAGDMEQVRELITNAAHLKPQAHTFDMSHSEPQIVRFMSRTGG
jgi:cyclic pyranopterin phosphate synthase